MDTKPRWEMSICLDIENLKRVFGKLDCPNVIGIVSHAGFMLATQDTPPSNIYKPEDTDEWIRTCFALNQLADALISFAKDLVTNPPNTNTQKELTDFDETCKDLLDSLNENYPMFRKQ